MKRTKLRILHALIFPIFLYVSECWILDSRPDKINAFETFLLSKNTKDFMDSNEDQRVDITSPTDLRKINSRACGKRDKILRTYLQSDKTTSKRSWYKEK